MTNSKPEIAFYVDAFSYCNLRCPSCIVGNEFGPKDEWPKGLMSVAMLDAILDKATAECDVPWVGLHNWTEPLLNPALPDLIRAIKARGIVCRMSSNLNVREDYDFEALLAARPDWLRLSMSGFTQPVYERGHAAGDIELVKRNMKRLSAAARAVGKGTRIDVLFHIYNDNGHEAPLMKKFAEDLGFTFSTIYAQIFPAEKVIDIHEGRVSENDRKVMDRLALPVTEALAITSRKPAKSCYLSDNQIVIDVAGNVMLCCGASMNRVNSVGKFLDLSFEEIQARKNSHKLCGSCLAINVPGYFYGSKELDALAEENLARVSREAAAATRNVG